MTICQNIHIQTNNPLSERDLLNNLFSEQDQSVKLTHLNFQVLIHATNNKNVKGWPGFRMSLETANISPL